MNILNNRVTAILAAVFALVMIGGVGGAFAASQITGHDIKNHTITGKDVHKGTLSYWHLTDGLKARIGSGGADGATGPAGADGAQGAEGPAGPKGDTGDTGDKGNKGDTGDKGNNGKGPKGADGVSGLVYVGPEVRWTDGAGTVTANCPEGKSAIGGGFTIQGVIGGDAVVKVSQPVYVSASHASGWLVEGVATGRANVKAWAVCVTVAD